MEKHNIGLVNILLIEDNPGDVRLIKESLKENKFFAELIVITDGEEAMQYLIKASDSSSGVPVPDIILLDLNLPRKDGREILVEIKKDDNLKAIPVIVLTSSSNEGDVLSSYREYANCFISKPIELNNFIEVMKSMENFWLTVVKLPTHKA